MMNQVIFLLMFVFAVSAAASAQNRPAVEAEILAMRQKIARAIADGDRRALAEFFTDDFVHTHATGKINDKQQRLDGLLDGGANIESVTPEEIRVRAVAKNAVVAHGRTRITAEGKAIVYRWTAVYVREKGRWRVAATQAGITEEQ